MQHLEKNNKGAQQQAIRSKHNMVLLPILTFIVGAGVGTVLANENNKNNNNNTNSNTKTATKPKRGPGRPKKATT